MAKRSVIITLVLLTLLIIPMASASVVSDELERKECKIRGGEYVLSTHSTCNPLIKEEGCPTGETYWGCSFSGEDTQNYESTEKLTYRDRCSQNLNFYTSNPEGFECETIFCTIEGKIKEVEVISTDNIRLRLTEISVNSRGGASDIACPDLFGWSDEQDVFVTDATPEKSEKLEAGKRIKGFIAINLSSEYQDFIYYTLKGQAEDKTEDQIEEKPMLLQRFFNWIKSLFTPQNKA